MTLSPTHISSSPRTLTTDIRTEWSVKRGFGHIVPTFLGQERDISSRFNNTINNRRFVDTVRGTIPFRINQTRSV